MLLHKGDRWRSYNVVDTLEDEQNALQFSDDKFDSKCTGICHQRLN